MALRVPLKTCKTRHLTGSVQPQQTVWRNVSPNRKINPTSSCEMSTYQQTFNCSSGNKKNGNDHETKKKKSTVEVIKEQLIAVKNMRDNKYVSSLVNNVSYVATSVSTSIPRGFATDFQKYVPFVKDASNIEQAKLSMPVPQKKVILVRDPVHHNREQHTLEEAMTFEYLPPSETHYYMKRTNVTTKSAQSVIETQKGGNLIQNMWARASFRSSGSPKSDKPITKPLIQKDFISRAVIDSRTRALVHSIQAAKSISSKTTRTEELCNHLLQHHNSRVIAYKEKVVPDLIAFKKSSDKTLRGMASEALALIGYIPPLKSRGIRILSIDGGGTRGLIPIEMIRQLQALCPDGNILNKFDYICGVSTGALIAGLIFLEKKSVDVAEALYKEFSIQTFSRNRIAGATDLFWNHSWYETKVWENILKDQIGNKSFIECSRDPECPKFSAVSTLMNVTKLRNFLFRNYNLPPGVYSNYPGSANNKIWEGIRASSAAPMYFEHFELGDYIHNDGGLLTNNPTFVAIDESKLLWPDEQIQCVISLGTGRYEPNYEFSPKISLTEKGYKILESATDTEAVHRQCQTLLPPQTYFRFNPYMSEELQLDEIRPEKLDIMEKDAKMYLRKNRKKMDYAISRLYETRGLRQKGKDLLYGKKLFP